MLNFQKISGLKKKKGPKNRVLSNLIFLRVEILTLRKKFGGENPTLRKILLLFWTRTRHLEKFRFFGPASDILKNFAFFGPASDALENLSFFWTRIHFHESRIPQSATRKYELNFEIQLRQ